MREMNKPRPQRNYWLHIILNIVHGNFSKFKNFKKKLPIKYSIDFFEKYKFPNTDNLQKILYVA